MKAGYGFEAEAAPAPARKLKPTREQREIVDAFAGGGDLVVNAGAGTGKTSTLRLLASAKPSASMVYVAYNKSIADESKRTFPSNVSCATSHSIAFRAVGREYAHRLNGPRVPSRYVAEALKIRGGFPAGGGLAPLSASKLASLVLAMVRNFCYSAADEVAASHLPWINGVDEIHHAALATELLPYARAAWEDVASVEGRLPFQHDHYLKIWALSKPRLAYDVVLLDEAQDANPALADVVGRQTSAQRVLVGDQAQAIYGWRGAVDAMETFEGRRLVLSQSFRFGQAIADEANKWLEIVDAPLRLSGYSKVKSRVADVDAPAAVLCRTNAEAVLQVMQATDDGRRAALAGGGEAIKAMARAAIQLRAGVGTDHPELMAFKTWAEVRAYVKDEDEGGRDLRVFVKLIDAYGAEGVIATIDRAAVEPDCDVVASTAHKAKGREWSSVRIAGDFPQPEKGRPSTPEAMLAYVSVTRAREVLDRGSLAYVDRLVRA